VQKRRAEKPVEPRSRASISGNGARLERSQLACDTSAKGMREAAGLMVNTSMTCALSRPYHEAFANSGAVAASDQVEAQLPTFTAAPMDISSCLRICHAFRGGFHKTTPACFLERPDGAFYVCRTADRFGKAREPPSSNSRQAGDRVATQVEKTPEA